MRNVTRLLVPLVTVIGCAWLATGDPINNPSTEGGDNPAPRDCNCNESGTCSLVFGTGEVETKRSLSVTINLGSAAFPGALSGGALHLYAQAPSAQLATPEALTWTFGTRILFVSADKTASGEPREVTLEDRDGRQVKFRFEDGIAWAYPQGKFRDTSRRLFMVDANGVAVTQNPAWYDLTYGNENVDRFAAQPDASGIRPLAAVYVAGGRWLTLANSGLEVVRDTVNALRQIKTASALADIVTVSDRKYRIDFYGIADVQKTGNQYVSSGAPKVTWTIENPSTSSVDRLTITRTIGGSSKVYDARYTPYLGRWVVTAPDDLLKDEIYSFWDASETIREEHRKVLNQAGQVVRHSIKKWQKFAWEQAVVAEIDDPDGAALTTTNTYYTNTAETGRYSRLKTVLNADGSWTRYDYDGTGRMIEEVRPIGDGPLTTAKAQARVTTYSYAPVDPNDTAALGDQRPRTIVETALGQEVSRTYQAYALIGGEPVEITEQCAQPGAAYGAASNQRSVNRHYGATNTATVAGLLRRIERPDGTTASYDYAFGTCNAAAPSFTAGTGAAYRVMVTDGTMDHPEGIANKTTRKTNVYDSRGFNVLSETWVFTGGTNYARIAWTARTFDAFGHATDVLYSNGQREEATWDDCCGKSSDVAADGVRTDYTYDALGRVRIIRRVGNPATGQPDLYTTHVYDTVGRQIAQTTSVGGLSQTTSNRYDTAGRLLSSTDTAGLVTTYAYPGPLTSVTISPGGLLTNTTVRYPDGQTHYTTQNGIRQQTYAYGVNADGTQWTRTYTGPLGTNSPVWQKTTTDLLGRTIRTERPGFGGSVLVSSNFFDTANHLVRTTSSSAGGVYAVTLFAYDSLGAQTRSGLDVNGNGTLDLAGPDRVSESRSWYEQDASNNWWQTSASILYPVAGSSTPTTNALQRTRLTGLNAASGQRSESISLDVLGNPTISRTFLDRDAKTVTQTTLYPDSTNAAIQVTINGLTQYTISKTGVRTDYAYDALGRQVSALQGGPGAPRTVGSFTHFDSLGFVDYVEDAASNRTTFAYDSTTGRRLAVTDALSNTTHTAYDPEGRVIATWGATYPVAYAYDAYGRMVVMATFRVEGGAGDQTQWLYDEATGLLTNKVYADGKSPSYAYTPQGQLVTRTWARGVVTTYAYATDGAMTNIAYSDGTPSVSFVYDRLGRQTAITDATGIRTFAYNDALQLAAETNAFGVITRHYDSFGRSSGLAVGSAYQVGYGYLGDGRFASVTSSVQSVSSVVEYSYLPGTDIISGYTNSAGLAVTRTYEPHRDLLTAVSNRYNDATVSAFDYLNDTLARRTARIDSGSATATNQFGYNPRSELTSALMGTNAYSYAFDPIGNRTTASNNNEAIIYLANALNQYTNILCAPAPLREDIPAYDLDGNMTFLPSTSGGGAEGWHLQWNGENRLIQASNAAHVVTYAYDYQGRMVSKQISRRGAEAQSWEIEKTSTLIWDGFNIIQVLTHSQTHTLTNAYVWGLDLSGSLQGAGGVGGLLAEVKDGVPYFAAFDANGNITDYVATNGAIAAHYEYSPFGEIIVQSGDLANAFTHRFSTKSWCAVTGLSEYEFRMYSPVLGRWVNRDPIGESGGFNLYGFLDNTSIHRVDNDGRMAFDWGPGFPDHGDRLPLKWSTYVLEGCNPGEMWTGGWQSPRSSPFERRESGNHVRFDHKCGVYWYARPFSDGICNTAMITTQDGQNKDSRSGIALFAKNDSKCCTRFKISCKWEYKGSGHGGSSGGQGGLSIMPAWEKWYEKDFSKVERPGGYVTSVSLFVPSTDASGEVDIPFGEEKKVFALSAYIHAGVWGSSAELEESGSIQCSAICASGE